MRKEMGRDVPRIVSLVIGNRLVVKEMARPVQGAGCYAPALPGFDNNPRKFPGLIKAWCFGVPEHGSRFPFCLQSWIRWGQSG